MGSKRLDNILYHKSYISRGMEGNAVADRDIITYGSELQ